MNVDGITGEVPEIAPSYPPSVEPPQEVLPPQVEVADKLLKTEAKVTGFKDWLIIQLFRAGMLALSSLLTGLLAYLGTIEVTPLFAIVVGAASVFIADILKAIDRYKHESPNGSTGLLKV